MQHFSATTGGFYDDRLFNGSTLALSMPPDAKPETEWSDTYSNIVTNRPPAKIIEADRNGCPVLADSPVDLGAYASAKQHALASGGYTVTVAGEPLTLATDPASEMRMTGKSLRLQQAGAPTANFTWPRANGQGVAIAPADFIAVAEQVADFIQATSDVLLLTALPGIAASTITTIAEIDALSWPPNVSSTSA